VRLSHNRIPDALLGMPGLFETINTGLEELGLLGQVPNARWGAVSQRPLKI